MKMEINKFQSTSGQPTVCVRTHLWSFYWAFSAQICTCLYWMTIFHRELEIPMTIGAWLAACCPEKKKIKVREHLSVCGSFVLHIVMSLEGKGNCASTSLHLWAEPLEGQTWVIMEKDRGWVASCCCNKKPVFKCGHILVRLAGALRLTPLIFLCWNLWDFCTTHKKGVRICVSFERSQKLCSVLWGKKEHPSLSQGIIHVR